MIGADLTGIDLEHGSERQHFGDRLPVSRMIPSLKPAIADGLPLRCETAIANRVANFALVFQRYAHYFFVTDWPSLESLTSQPAAAISSRSRSLSAQFFALRASAR